MSFVLQQAEWKELRNEAISLAQEARSVERYVIAASGAVYTWLATHTETQPSGVVWYLPVMFVVLAGFRMLAMANQISHLADYLKQIESNIGEGTTGWEHYFSSRRGLLGNTSILVWIALLLSTLVAPRFLAAKPVDIRQSITLGTDAAPFVITIKEESASPGTKSAQAGTEQSHPPEIANPVDTNGASPAGSQ